MDELDPDRAAFQTDERAPVPIALANRSGSSVALTDRSDRDRGRDKSDRNVARGERTDRDHQR